MIAALRYLRLRGFDTSTAEGRDAERYRRAGWAVLSNVGSRVLSMLLVVLSVHLTLPYLGTARFGVWATFASMATMLSLLDLGVGNALVNRVAHASAGGDKSELQRVVTGGCGILAVIGLASAALLFGLAEILPWGRVFKLSDAALIAEAHRAGAGFAACFGVNLFSAGLLRVLAGQQRLYAANAVSAVGTSIACLALALASSRQVGIPILIASTFGVQAAVSLFAGVLLYRADLWQFRELWSAMLRERSHLLKTGSLFVLLQLGTMIGWGSDSVLLASLKGAGEVAVFAVAMRLFQFASQPFAVVNAPLWAAYADARARRDTAFIRRTLRRSLGFSLVGCIVVSATLLAFAPILITAWTKDSVVVPASVLLLFALWTVLDTTGNAFGVFLNGCGIVQQQVWVVSAFCCVVLPLKLFLGDLWGAPGILAATIAAYLLVVVGGYALPLRAKVLEPLRGGTSQ